METLRSVEMNSQFYADHGFSDLINSFRVRSSVSSDAFANLMGKSAEIGVSSRRIMYREDLMDRAGVTLSDTPTWSKVRNAAAAITDKKNGVYGICLRSKPGRGDNMAFLTAMANTFGAQLFDQNWYSNAKHARVGKRGQYLHR